MASPAAHSVTIDRVLCLQDNYVWVLHDQETGLTAVVDPSEAQVVSAALKAK